MVTTLIVAVLLVVVVLSAFIGVPMFIRYLADEGWFWVRVPEMRAVAVMKDRGFSKMIIACSAARFEQIKQNVIDNEENPDYLISVSDGKMTYIGAPWNGNEVKSWYNYTMDEINPNVDPCFSLYLGERALDYGGNDKNWSVDTADPIQVFPKLSVVMQVVNPRKVIFDVEYYEEALMKEIMKAWKDSVEGLRYFNYSDSNNPERKDDLQSAAQAGVNKFLGLPAPDDITEVTTTYIRQNSSTPIFKILNDYGIWIKRVYVRDIDPVDPEIRKSLEERSKAVATAASARAKATGDRDAKILEAEGDAKSIEKKGMATAKVTFANYKAQADGLEKVATSLQLDKGDRGVLVALEMTDKLAKGAQYTYITGDPGHVATWPFAVMDSIKNHGLPVAGGSKDTTKTVLAEKKPADGKSTKRTV